MSVWLFQQIIGEEANDGKYSESVNELICHIIPEHVLTDMKSPKGLDNEFLFQRYQGTLFHKK